ncbi:MAG: DUF1761 domain-containing protein [Leptospiraceae bacterium]|nr:DUF1761 domain-containing protein [Leptospiraceae bacterium]
MQPALHFNIYAMIVAVLANMFIGFLWFGPVFGRPWAKEMGYNIDEMKPDSKQMTKSMILMIVGTILSVFVLAHIVEVWRPSVWGQGADQAAWTYGFFGGFFTWIGFHVPMLLGQIAWESRSWKLFIINAGYHFVSLQAIGMILSYWRG